MVKQPLDNLYYIVTICYCQYFIRETFSMHEQLLSERIKIARENIGITKAEAARRLNLSKIGYCRFEYGERTPSIQTLEVIARCFNTSIDYLTGKTDNMNPDCFVISKKDTPVLFDLVAFFQNSNDESIKRLLAYYNALTFAFFTTVKV